jgi:transcriptional regulator with PAS, ATPase and Fis domain
LVLPALIIFLPIQSLKGRRLSFILNYEESSSQFILSSTNEEPFSLNGNFCYKAVIKQGDIVSLEYNTIHFSVEPTSAPEPWSVPQEIKSSQVSILLEGETGTGKTFAAKKIHADSGRVGEFIHLNLSAYPETLLESKLFGHSRGAFTGADSDRPGVFEAAKGGTVFLDELNSVGPAIQTKLLLCLEEKEITRIGSHQRISIDCRFIFATGEDLAGLVEKGHFRRDLFYRVTAGFCYRLNSLREDKNLILNHLGLVQNKYSVIFSKELVEMYLNYAWPGNIRQLISHLEKKILISKKRKLTYCSLDMELMQLSKKFMFNQMDGVSSLDRIKREYVSHVFNIVKRDIQAASKILQVNPKTVKALLPSC